MPKWRATIRTLVALGLVFSPLLPLGAAGVVAAPLCLNDFDFDSSHFSDSATITNRYLPLVPGTQMTLRGQANRGQGGGSHKVVFTVTDLTKVIDGVPAAVIWDRDYQDGVLVERELAFFAQDNAGNVWNLGEYPEEFKDGQFLGAPKTWIAGLAGAEAGIHMLAEPRVAARRYVQGWAPDITFLDCARVFKMGEKVCVHSTCYEDVLVTDETSPLAPLSGHQRKYHAPGVGIIKVSGALRSASAEVLTLTKIEHLSPEGLSEAHEKALKLNARGCKNSDTYRKTCD